MCPKTTFVTGRGVNQRAVKLAPIFEALCPAKKAAPPVFHAITGADNTGSFLGKGKITCWKEFQEVHNSILTALANLGRDEEPDDDIKGANQEVRLRTVCTKDRHDNSQRAQVVPLLKEASRV